MYDETMKDPCKYGLAEHVGEQLCVRCGAIYDAVTGSWGYTDSATEPVENAQGGEDTNQPTAAEFFGSPEFKDIHAAVTAKANQLSACHSKPVKLSGGIGDFHDDDRPVTMHYVCLGCGEPCNLLTNQPAPYDTRMGNTEAGIQKAVEAMKAQPETYLCKVCNSLTRGYPTCGRCGAWREMDNQPNHTDRIAKL